MPKIIGIQTPSGNIAQGSGVFTVNDARLYSQAGLWAPPPYAIAIPNSTVNETTNSVVTFNVTTSLSAATTVFWQITTVSGVVTVGDFVGGTTTGSFQIPAGVATNQVAVTVAADATTEISEQLRLQIRLGTTGGIPAFTSGNVLIEDTSFDNYTTVTDYVVTVGNFKTHVFNTSGTLTFGTAPLTGNVEYFIAAGGGGGGVGGDPGSGNAGGGGGAGGVLLGVKTNVGIGSYPIVVGGGGNKGTSLSVAGSNGSASSALGISSTGGGGGGSAFAPNQAGKSGGSGGGGGATLLNSPSVGGNGVLGQGNAGAGAGIGAPISQYQVNFNGTSQYLTTPAGDNYNITGNFTVECWVYMTATGNNPLLTVGYPRTQLNYGFAINSNSTVTWISNPSNNWSATNTYTTSATVPLNTWTHIAAVKNVSTFTIYINGTSAYSTNSFVSPTKASQILYIGTYFANTNNDGSFFRGSISNFRIVKGTAVYTGAFTPPTSTLTAIANTSLLICKSASFVDLSVNAATITPVNSPTISVGTLSLTDSASLAGGGGGGKSTAASGSNGGSGIVSTLSGSSRIYAGGGAGSYGGGQVPGTGSGPGYNGAGGGNAGTIYTVQPGGSGIVMLKYQWQTISNQAEFTAPGTYSWTAPADVTSVCVVCVGGGGGGLGAGQSASRSDGPGGGGGGLGWRNDIPVVSGQTYTVVVGAGGIAGVGANGGNGGTSYFINSSTVAGFGGLGGNYVSTPAGGNYVGDGGGRGGSGGGTVNNYAALGGGGAGGYSGNGGAGSASGSANGAGSAGAGGGGGGGASAYWSQGAGTTGGAGGGVGIYGQGTDGSGAAAGAVSDLAGAGGLGGSAGSNGGSGTSILGGSGGLFGGGGGGNSNGSGGSGNVTGGAGSRGAVRIIWGPGRAFPSTLAGNVAVV